MTEEKLSPTFYDKKGNKVAGLTEIPAQYVTRFIEFDNTRYERQKDGSYHEVGKAQGIKGDSK